MFDARHEPATDWRTNDPLFPEETAGLLFDHEQDGVEPPAGMTLHEVDAPEPRHMCGKCMNPYTREGNPECRNR